MTDEEFLREIKIQDCLNKGITIEEWEEKYKEQSKTKPFSTLQRYERMKNHKENK